MRKRVCRWSLGDVLGFCVYITTDHDTVSFQHFIEVGDFNITAVRDSTDNDDSTRVRNKDGANLELLLTLTQSDHSRDIWCTVWT